jgi:hypothetical protein
MPGTYTVRLRKAGKSIESRIDVALDRRATYSVEDRRKNYDAQLKVVALFGDMSALMGRIDAAQKGTAERTGKLPKGDPLVARLQALREKLEQVRRKIVTTKEGGAITGEERIREHTDHLYGALLRYEGKPAAYQETRIVALRRELEDVQKEFDQLAATEVRAIDAVLRERNLPPIPTSASAALQSQGPTMAALTCWMERDCEAEPSRGAE